MHVMYTYTCTCVAQVVMPEWGGATEYRHAFSNFLFTASLSRKFARALIFQKCVPSV